MHLSGFPSERIRPDASFPGALLKAILSDPLYQCEKGKEYSMLHIISDSTCDLSPELIERYQIRILPLNVNLGEETYIDGKTITPEELYAWSDRTRQTPKTAVFSETTAMDLFSECLKDGGEIICFAISESMSASAQVMRMAASELHAEDRVHVVDSANLSTGISLLILLAADLAAEGRPVAEILEIIEKKKPLVRSSFVVDTLTYLHRGGRCSGAAALVGTVLKLHPTILVHNGKMEVGKKYHSGIFNVLKRYEKDLEPDLLRAEPRRVFITHSGCNPEWVAELQETLQALHYFDEVLVTRAGSVVSSHCGPNTLGILYMEKEDAGSV